MARKLLLADNSAAIRRVIELTFAGEDIEVVAVQSGDAALQRARAEPPDIVLVDAGLPDPDGYEVARAIRSDPALSATPVILMVGAFERVDAARARAAGCAGVLSKPFDPQTVVAQVRDLLQQRPARPAAEPPETASEPPPPRAHVIGGGETWIGEHQAGGGAVAGPDPVTLAEAAVAASPAPEGPRREKDDYFERLDAAFSARLGVRGAVSQQPVPATGTSAAPVSADSPRTEPPPAPHRRSFPERASADDEDTAWRRVSPAPAPPAPAAPAPAPPPPPAAPEATEPQAAAPARALEPPAPPKTVPPPEEIPARLAPADVERAAEEPVHEDRPGAEHHERAATVAAPADEPAAFRPSPPALVPEPEAVAPESPAGAPVETPVAAASAGRPEPSRRPTPAASPRAAGAATGTRLPLADAFTALLAAEQGGAPASLPALGAREPVVSDELVEAVTRRVLERLGGDHVREAVREIVMETAERLVREEIERIKSGQ